MDHYSFYEKDILGKLAQRSESQCTQIHTGSGRVGFAHKFLLLQSLPLYFIAWGGNKTKQTNKQYIYINV